MLSSLAIRRIVSRLPKGGIRLTKLLSSFNPQAKEYRLPVDSKICMFLDSADVFQAQMAFGTYQAKLIKAIRGLALPGDRVLVAGSHVGYLPINIALMGCAVYACEADPRNSKVSLRNFRLNSHLIISLAEVGLSESEAEIPIWLSDITSNSSFAIAHQATSQANVAVRSGDDILQEFGVSELDGLLLDVEGWEVRALRGLRKTLRKRPRWAVLECAPWALEAAGSSESELRGAIRDLGWTKITQIGDDLVCS